MAAGMRLDFDRMAHYVLTRLVGARLTASEGAARRAVSGDAADRVGAAWRGRLRARRPRQTRGQGRRSRYRTHVRLHGRQRHRGTGEKELETDSTGRFGKLGGSYNNVATALEAKYTFSERFRLSVDATIAYYDISGVSGLDDRRRGALQSISFDARYRLFDRERAPFGLTLSVEPHWGFADEMSGAPADQQRAAFRVLADRELIADRLFAALNISYEPEQTRLRGSGETLRNSTLGVSAALAMQVMPGVFIGAEARNLRHYDGLGLDGFAGQALYIGPTLYATFGERYFISAAWNVQVWGAVGGTSGALDLDNFERHQVKLRAGVRF
jgi:hypothetical protein